MGCISYLAVCIHTNRSTDPNQTNGPAEEQSIAEPFAVVNVKRKFVCESSIFHISLRSPSFANLPNPNHLDSPAPSKSARLITPV
jgi:hypothetical protein